MATQQLKKSALAIGPSKTHQEKLQGKKSTDLVIALAGPLGCGIKEVIDVFKTDLKNRGYQVHHIKVSDEIKKHHKQSGEPLNIDSRNEASRIESLQSAGNSLREKHGESHLAALAITQISELRHKDGGHVPASSNQDIKKNAFIIDQLKHPEEVKLLRNVYQDLFYLVGVLAYREKRIERLTDIRNIEEQTALNLIAIDRRQDQKHGQRLEDTLHLSDFFLQNNEMTQGNLEPSVSRFISILFAETIHSPTEHEYGMYCAYASAKRSACLSRQVGAAVLAQSGEVIATGRNDVPKANGGLYGDKYSDLKPINDYRCFKYEAGICHNDKHKNELKDQIEAITQKELSGHESSEQLAKSISEKIYGETRLKSLIEFSRSIHAEMDALLSIARIPGASTVGASLYSTTYPCHNCARHIVAAGIKKVVYIEPYEKSLAIKLHKDSICLSGAKQDSPPEKIQFVQFSGVSPILYDKVFSMNRPRKDSAGKVIRGDSVSTVRFEYVESYLNLETKIAAEVLESYGDQAD